MQTRPWLSALCAFPMLAAIGCKSEKARLDQASPDSAEASRTHAQLPAKSASDFSTWKLRSRGLGPLKAGMSFSEVSSSLPGFKSPIDASTSDCTYSRSAALPSGTVLMFTKSSLARIDILSGPVQSDLGARIGDTEDQLKLLYGKSVRTTPHKYTDGHYMTVLSESDSSYRIVFETDGTKILRFRSGRMPEVEYVEGCG